ncbi:MAG: pantoate--beta-alanine ligase [Bacteroidota bacterium]
MWVFRQVQQLQTFVRQQKKQGRHFGFAPTMGALHEGHVSLIKQAKVENELAVASIFVNPTQFNESSDLEKYPRTEEKDLLLLEKVGCDVVFLPSVEEVYPSGLDTTVPIDLGYLVEPMEGQFRPGHFEGVVEVVHRLLEITLADSLYMGQKDYQQFAVVQEMIRQLSLPVHIVRCPIIREEDGLAKSSRNVRLTAQDRHTAPALYQLLQRAQQQLLEGQSPSSISAGAMQFMAELPNFRPEYFSIVDGSTLRPIIDKDQQHQGIVACLACWAGQVRLIDNHVLLEKSTD